MNGGFAFLRRAPRPVFDPHRWWRVALRELPSGLTLGAMMGAVGIVRIAIWQQFGPQVGRLTWSIRRD